MSIKRSLDYIKVPERLRKIKRMLTPDVLTFCAQDPRNGYPVIDPYHHFHLVSESGLSKAVLTDIHNADTKRIYSEVKHFFSVLPDDEYAGLHEKALRRRTPIIPTVFTLEVAKHELLTLKSETLLDLLVDPLINHRCNEIVHFVPKSMWNDEAEDALMIEDLDNGTPGVISHYVNIVEDDDLNEIIDPLLVDMDTV